jgi:hypothetical protein
MISQGCSSQEHQIDDWQEVKNRIVGGLCPRPSWGVSHDGEEKNEFQGVNDH